MIALSIEANHLQLRMTGLDVLWALKGTLRIAFTDIHAARVERVHVGRLGGVKLYGTYVPRWIAAGTFAGTARRRFYAARHGRDALVLELQRGPYERCVVTLGEPRVALEAIRSRARHIH